jgi:hypothetical protein
LRPRSCIWSEALSRTRRALNTGFLGFTDCFQTTLY